MIIKPRFILLLKAQKSHDEIDKYEQLLTENNYSVKSLKTLDFNYINLEELRAHLKTPECYSGLIFTSPRCVLALKKCLGNETLNSSWKSNDNYVVGCITYDSAWNDLKLNCKGKESGNATNLSEIINSKTSEKSYVKPFLAPRGNLRTDTLSLKPELIKEIVVYETVTNLKLEDEFCEATSTYSILPEFVVFFSPSGVKAASKSFKNISEHISGIKVNYIFFTNVINFTTKYLILSFFSDDCNWANYCRSNE